MNPNKYTVRFLLPEESFELGSFLSKPTIDKSFRPPLSRRALSIGDRVTSKFSEGFWLGAFSGDQIIGCRGCNGITNGVVEFSTTVVSDAHRRTGLGRALIATGVIGALSKYGRYDMMLDTTPDNIAVANVVQRLGFVGTKPYLDEAKRGGGGSSVLYTLEAGAILPPGFNPQGLGETDICNQIARINPSYACVLNFIDNPGRFNNSRAPLT